MAVGAQALIPYASHVTQWGGQPAADGSKVEDLIDAASEWALRYCKRYLKSQSVGPEYYDADGGVELMLKNYPVTAVDSIYQDPNRDYGSGTEISSDDFEIYEDEGIILLTNAVFLRGRRIIKITYTAGYTSIPNDLSNAMIELVNYWYDKFTNKRYGVKSVGDTSRQITYTDDIPLDVQAIVRLYRKKGIA